MSDVKRAYDASGRRAQALAARSRVLQAARARFLRDGYAATTVAAIAEDAGVSPKTVAKQFGNKPGLLKALFDAALVGDAHPDGLEQRAHIMAIHAEPDATKKLELFAAALVDMLPRTAPIQLLLLETASDPDLAQVWDTIKAGRREGMLNVARNLTAGGHLRAEVSTDQAADILWTYSSPQLYELLVLERGWNPAQYEAFVARALVAHLL
jgi:AcrR family transcriptional regulator